MPGREAARQAAGERLRCAQRGAAGLGSGVEAAEPHRRSGEPIPSERSRSRGGLEMVPGGYGAARGGSRRPEHNPQQTAAALAPIRDGAAPRAYLLWAAAAFAAGGGRFQGTIETATSCVQRRLSGVTRSWSKA
jgi:hypothetical protein